LRALVDADDALSAFIPDFRYLVCDLNHDDLAQLQGHATLQVAVRLFHQEFGERLPKIAAFFREVLKQTDGLGYLQTVLRYISQSTDKIDDNTLQTIVQRALPQIGDTIMPTIAETWEKRGLQKGLEKGRQEGRQEEMAHARADVISILEARFGDVPELLAQRIKALDDLAKLRQLLTKAAITDSMDAFREMVSR
jgi:hypothetical protein